MRSSTSQCSNAPGTSRTPSGAMTVGTMSGPSARRVGGGLRAGGGPAPELAEWVDGGAGWAEVDLAPAACRADAGCVTGTREGPATACALVGSCGALIAARDRLGEDEPRGRGERRASGGWCTCGGWSPCRKRCSRRYESCSAAKSRVRRGVRDDDKVDLALGRGGTWAFSTLSLGLACRLIPAVIVRSVQEKIPGSSIRGCGERFLLDERLAALPRELYKVRLHDV